MDITIYSTAQCAACHALTDWLDKQGLSYTKKVTDEDPAIMDEFMAVNGGMIGVPFTIITTEDAIQTKLTGFEPAAFKKVLGIV